MRHSKREGGYRWNMWTPTLEEKVAFLRDPRSYNASVQQVDVRETHMSWVSPTSTGTPIGCSCGPMSFCGTGNTIFGRTVLSCSIPDSNSRLALFAISTVCSASFYGRSKLCLLTV